MSDITPYLPVVGKIRSNERCPKCKGKFQGNPLICPSCLTHPTRYYIDLYIKGKGRAKIYSDRLGKALSSWDSAESVLTVIRSEIKYKTFDPSKYIKAEQKQFLFENRIKAWEQDKLIEVEKGNISRDYVRSLKMYARIYYLPFFKKIDVREIRTFHIQEFYNQLPADKSLKYFWNILKGLENFFNALHKLDYIEKKPSFPIITIDRKSPNWIDRDTQEKILTVIPPEHRPIFLFLFHQPVRPGEARALKVKDINFEGEYITISRTSTECGEIRERVKSKVVKPRAINPILISTLQECCKDKLPEAFVFINPIVKRIYSATYLKRIWNKALNKLGLKLKLYEATRHSWASNAVLDSVPIQIIQKVLGHTNINTTLKYADVNLEAQRIAFKSLKSVRRLSVEKKS